MANFSLNLGSSLTGLTDLRAEWLDESHAVLSTTSSGFSELTDGQYTFISSIPAQAAFVRFYSNANSSTKFFTLAVAEGATIPASGSPATVNAYLYTRDSHGSIVAGARVYYQRIGVDADYTDSWDDEVNTLLSDSDGLAEIVMSVGSFYKYWVRDGRFRTVHITADTSDPFALPEVQG